MSGKHYAVSVRSICTSTGNVKEQLIRCQSHWKCFICRWGLTNNILALLLNNFWQSFGSPLRCVSSSSKMIKNSFCTKFTAPLEWFNIRCTYSHTHFVYDFISSTGTIIFCHTRQPTVISLKPPCPSAHSKLKPIELRFWYELRKIAFFAKFCVQTVGHSSAINWSRMLWPMQSTLLDKSTAIVVRLWSKKYWTFDGPASFNRL